MRERESDSLERQAQMGQALARHLAETYGPQWDVELLKGYFHTQFFLFDLAQRGQQIPCEVWECMEAQWNVMFALHERSYPQTEDI